jgi:hypothetical protein
MAASLWVIAGFAFPFLTPATNLLSAYVLPSLVARAGMADELAYRVAFTIVRLPLTAVLAVAIAAAQYAVIPDVWPVVRRWLAVAAPAALLAVLIWLPTTLIVSQFVGATFPEPVRVLLLTFGAGLLAGLVSVAQRRTARRVVTVPGSFVATAILAAILGALGGWAL